MARPRLFSKYDLRETLERREAQLKKALDA